jgi:hypothetical protein
VTDRSGIGQQRELAVGAGSLFALGYAVNDLANGFVEAPEHWWSSAPLLGLAAAVTLRDRAAAAAPLLDPQVAVVVGPGSSTPVPSKPTGAGSVSSTVTGAGSEGGRR